MKCWLAVTCVLAGSLVTLAEEEQCPVCVKVLTDVIAKMPTAKKIDQTTFDKTIRSHCKDLKGKENKMCFYVGALPESATSIMNEVTKPLSWGMPPSKVCQKLKVMDAQICDLKYDKGIDWKTVDLKKLKVRELKKILDNWGEACKGCTEKAEYVARITELKPQFVKEEL